MGSNQPSQIIHNRHFASLQVTPADSKEKSMMLGSVAVPSASFLEQWAKKYELVRREVHHHILLPMRWRVAESSLCGSTKIVEFQKFSRLLSEEVRLRGEQSRHLEQSQIWYLIWALSEVADQCSKLRQRVSDLSLTNVFMNDSGNIKLLTPFSLPDSFDPYSNPLVQDVYFSPQELKSRELGKMYNQSDAARSSSFSMGMLVLSLALLKPLYFLYDYDKNQIDYGLLENQLKNLGDVQFLSSEFNVYQLHSDAFQLLVRRLLANDSAQRVSASQVYDALKPFISQISTLKSFEFEVPQPLPLSPVKQYSPSPKATISLKSSKLRSQASSTPPSNSKTKKLSPPLVQSKYVPEEPVVPIAPVVPSAGVDFLRKIDERLQKSREQFPS